MNIKINAPANKNGKESLGMKRYFTNSNQTASASFAEASFSCTEMNSVMTGTVLVSVFVCLIHLLGIIILQEPFLV